MFEFRLTTSLKSGAAQRPGASATLSYMDVTARAMSGGQFYNENSLTQASASANGLTLIDAAVRDLRDVGPAPVVADFGSAGAGNSLQPVARAIELLRSQHAIDEVTVVHADLADNDWKAMFTTISERPDSYVNLATPTRVLAAAGSFYGQLLPSSWVDLAWTSGSLHWLSHPPCPINDHFFVQSSTDVLARTAFHDTSRVDWESFLSHRAVELRPTASLVFVDVLMGDDDVMGSEHLFNAVEEGIRHARNSGSLTIAECASLIYPTWFRSLADIRAPFPSFRGPNGARLELTDLIPCEIPDPFIAEYEAGGDADRYATNQIGFLRGFLEPTFIAQLSHRADAQVVVAGIWRAAAKEISADPSWASPTYRLVAGRIKRED